jgi:hypothetical protein
MEGLYTNTWRVLPFRLQQTGFCAEIYAHCANKGVRSIETTRVCVRIPNGCIRVNVFGADAFGSRVFQNTKHAESMHDDLVRACCLQLVANCRIKVRVLGVFLLCVLLAEKSRKRTWIARRRLESTRTVLVRTP